MSAFQTVMRVERTDQVRLGLGGLAEQLSDRCRTCRQQWFFLHAFGLRLFTWFSPFEIDDVCKFQQVHSQSNSDFPKSQKASQTGESHSHQDGDFVPLEDSTVDESHYWALNGTQVRRRASYWLPALP